MNTFGNIIWLILGGLVIAILYYLAGILICCTIIGIPYGTQLFKFGNLSLTPFGHEVIWQGNVGGWAIVFNVIWILLGWWKIAVLHSIFGIIFCITIVGIPFGIQHFKIAYYSLMPFGQTILSKKS